jgi:hypothetical protein
VRVPMLLRCPGIAPGEDSRLAASIDLAPTLAWASGADLPWSIDGRALQDAWDRERILIEGWGNPSTVAWAGVRTIDETYVAYVDGRTVLWDRRLDAEETSHLTAASAASWAAQLAALRDCMGAACGRPMVAGSAAARRSCQLPRHWRARCPATESMPRSIPGNWGAAQTRMDTMRRA